MFYLSHLIYLFCWISSVESTHFRGGFFSWKTVSPSITNTSTVTITISQTYSWANSVIPCGQLIGDTGYLICIAGNCSNYANTTSTRAPCISFDLGLDVSTATSTTTLTILAGSILVVAFQSSNWLSLVYGTLYPPWSLTTYINLAVRSDNGQINSSPTSSMSPLVNIIVNVVQTLRIPLDDIDLDVIKCRWAMNGTIISSNAINECEGVCQNMPNVQIYSTSSLDNNCTIGFSATITGYYAIALQIEDFMPSNPNGSALSSIPLQFLVRALNISCSAPSIIGELPNGDTIQVSAGTTYSVLIIAQIGCNGTSITRFSTITIPTGTASTSSITTVNASLYSIVFIWTPTTSQIGMTQLYCTMAIGSNNLQSAQYCLNLKIINVTSTETTSTVTTTISSNNQPDNTSLILGLSLGLGLAALALLGLITTLCCCRCCPNSYCARWRRNFWQEKNPRCSVCQSQNSTTTTNASRPTTKGTLTSRSINSITPVETVPNSSLSPTSSNLQFHSLNGSILDQAFRRQELSKNNNFY